MDNETLVAFAANLASVKPTTHPDLLPFGGEFASPNSFSGFHMAAGHPHLEIVYYAVRLDFKNGVNGNDQQLVILEEDLRPMEYGQPTKWREMKRYSKRAGDVFSYNIGGCGVAVAGRHLVVSLAMGKIVSDGQLHASRDILRKVVPQS